MSIARNLSWEIISQNEATSTEKQRIAVEIAYGVSLIIGDQPEIFGAVMSSIIDQVSDEQMKQNLRFFTVKGLRK